MSVWVKKSLIKKIYKKRPIDSHKGNFGNLLIIGGSKIYSGSPALIALAAINSGSDLTMIMAPERAANIAATFGPDLITYPLKGDYFSEKHVNDVKRVIEKYDAVTIGNGMCRASKTLSAIKSTIKFLKSKHMPVVIDADAIHAVAKSKILDDSFVLTPHALEFKALTGKKPPQEIDKREKAVEKAAKKLGCIILLKGHIDIISDGERTMLNKTGSPYLTKGGTGDVLTGICGALLARGVKHFYAACAAAYISGKAGQIAAKKYKESLMAVNVIEKIHEVIK
jgi:NAD(P)H-hydrate epimerase